MEATIALFPLKTTFKSANSGRIQVEQGPQRRSSSHPIPDLLLVIRNPLLVTRSSKRGQDKTASTGGALVSSPVPLCLKQANRQQTPETVMDVQ
jgi:hypothetical protein